MSKYPDIPHFSRPFRFENGRAAAVEQDSLEEITDCVAVLLDTQLGERLEHPDYGITDQTFKARADVDEIASQIAEWEPRVETLIEEAPDVYDRLIDRVTVTVGLADG